MIYVDEIQDAAPYNSKGYRSHKFSHLMADTEEELHNMAARIGCKREWCQFEGTDRIHYDIPPQRRAAALALGAIFVPQREQSRLRLERRKKFPPNYK